MRRLSVLAAGAGAAILILAVLSAGGSASHPGSRTLVFTETSKGETFRFIDLRPLSRRKGERATVSTGDEFVFGNNLLDQAKQPAGRVEGTCKALRGGRRFERARWGCQGFARLAGGTLSVTAVVNFSESDTIRGEVTGGSGAYEGANGSFTSRGEPSVDTFHIVTF